MQMHRFVHASEQGQQKLCVLLVQDPRIQRLPCTHSGTYADDCLCERVRQHKCYIVATCDRDLRRRIRKVRPAAAAGCNYRTALHCLVQVLDTLCALYTLQIHPFCLYIDGLAALLFICMPNACADAALLH